MDYELMMNSNIKIGQKAPEFTAVTTYGNKSLKDYKGKWLVFFSHPGDFTPVCTTEMIAFSKAYPYFQKMDTELLEKIEAINYDDKLTEINENILKSQEEYTKMIEEINNKNKPEEKPSNIISFESLKKKRKANKKVFSINENIMSEELETSSSYVIDLNSESFGIMAN